MKKLCIMFGTVFALSLVFWAKADAADYKFSMSYIYFGNFSGYTQLVDAAQNSLNEVSPNYFALDTDGSLILTNAVSQSFVDEAHSRGVKVVPYLSNGWDQQAGINALQNKDALTSSLAAAVDTYNLDGVNIDLENLNQNQRSDYVDFIRLLHDRLPSDKKVTAAVAANPWGATTGWQGSYDYAGLAASCDYLMIMAYDEHYDGGAPGPVASMSFIEKSIKYALTLVPKDKIVLGLPFYGRIWSDNGTYPNGYGVSNTRVDQLLSSYNGTVTVDSATQSARATITVGPTDTKPVVGGRTLDAGSYTIWYDNEQTMKEKLQLVQKYDLKGAGSWSLGQESADTWNYYRLWLNGCTFSDIENNWARDNILTAYMNGWVNGVSPDSFLPDAPLTRAQAAAMLVRLLGYPVEANTDYAFNDTKNSWAADYISTARRYNIVSGVGGNLFDPDRTVTREEIAVMLNNILGYTPSGSPAPFSDVTQAGDSWSYAAICALSENGVIAGYPDGNYKPHDNVSRAEMTTLLTRISISKK